MRQAPHLGTLSSEALRPSQSAIVDGELRGEAADLIHHLTGRGPSRRKVRVLGREGVLDDLRDGMSRVVEPQVGDVSKDHGANEANRHGDQLTAELLEKRPRASLSHARVIDRPPRSSLETSEGPSSVRMRPLLSSMTPSAIGGGECLPGLEQESSPPTQS